MNKKVGWVFFVFFFLSMHNPALPASSKASMVVHSKSYAPKKRSQNAEVRERNRHENHRFFSKKPNKSHKRNGSLKLPKGKLLASIVLLFVSIVFFAIAGVTVLGILFNALGSIAIIGSLVFFIFWLNDRSKQAKAPSKD